MAAVRARASRAHRNALTRVLRSTGLVNVPEEAMLVSTLRQLAKEMDEGGGTRITQLWLSAQKDLRRVMNGGTRVRGTAESSAAVKKTAPVKDSEVEPELPVPNDLANFKNKHRIAS